ncbi:MAG: HD domain-containing protein [Nanoarchaeota archaeon]|nr:HD domain-containing protein [Nanoarchaeota archaeon]
METEETVQQIREEAKKYFEEACPSHDWSHVERVYDLCNIIGEKEKAEMFILKLAALLHDIGRKKEMENPIELDHAIISAELALGILKKHNIDEESINKVIHCISSHRFRKEIKPETKEARILFDADKLDSIGAIGVARAYAWAGNKSIKIYSDKNYLGDGYEKEHSPLTEFLYKLSKVKDSLFTETARKIAEQRHQFMASFFTQLKQEIDSSQLCL